MFNQQSSYHNICTQNSFSEYQNEEKKVILFSYFSLSNNPQNAFPGVQKDSFLNFFNSGPTMHGGPSRSHSCMLFEKCTHSENRPDPPLIILVKNRFAL